MGEIDQDDDPEEVYGQGSDHSMHPSMNSDVDIIDKSPLKDNWKPCVVEE